MFVKGHKIEHVNVPKPKFNHTVRARSINETVEIKNYTRGKAIKIFCTECLGWGDHPNDCTSTLCPLFPFRGRTLMAYGSKIVGEIDSFEESDEE